MACDLLGVLFVPLQLLKAEINPAIANVLLKPRGKRRLLWLKPKSSDSCFSSGDWRKATQSGGKKELIQKCYGQ